MKITSPRKITPLKTTLTLVFLIFLIEFLLQGYHALFQSTFFFRHSYEQSKGVPYGEDYDFHLNSMGFKDVAFTTKKEAAYRIVAIGDSFTFGSVPYQNTFLTLIGEMLHQATPHIELLNMGVPSLPPHGYVSLLGLEGIQLQPDMILLSLFVGDDFSASKPKGFFDSSALISLVKKVLGQRKRYPGHIYHQGTYCDNCPVLNRERFLSIESKKQYLYKKNNPTFAEQFENILYSLRRIQNICKQEDIPLFVLIIPDVSQINSSVEQHVRTHSSPRISDDFWDISQPNQALAHWLTAENIPFLDLYPDFKQSVVPTYRINDVHWNLGACPRMPFYPKSSELSKNNARNIIHMAVLIFRKFFDFDQNAYSRTSS